MRGTSKFGKGLSNPLVISFIGIAVIATLVLVVGTSFRRLVREWHMQRVSSAHYEILFPSRALTPDSIMQFAARRETLFMGMNKKLGDAASNAKIRIVFDPAYSGVQSGLNGEQPFSTSDTIIRTKLNSEIPTLPTDADAQALLFAAWGKPGNARMARWVAIALTGEWRGAEIGMAAAALEQKLGYRNLETVLGDPPGQIPSVEDQDLLGAAWISEIAEFGGGDAVRKLYAAKMERPSVADATKALGTPPLELERKWQMWTYAYLAGMPAVSSGSSMPMDMPMAGSH